MAAFSSLGSLVFYAQFFCSGVASAQTSSSFETTCLNYLSTIDSSVASSAGLASTANTLLGAIEADVDNVEADLLTVNTHLGRIENAIGSSLSVDVGSIASSASSIDSRVASVVSTLTSLANDVATIKNNVGTHVSPSDLSSQIQQVTTRLDTIAGYITQLVSVDHVAPADVVAIKNGVNSLNDALTQLRTYNLVPIKNTLDNIYLRSENIATDTGTYLPDIVDRLDILISQTNAASSGPVMITNVVNFDWSVWEPFYSWTNFFLSFFPYDYSGNTWRNFEPQFLEPGYHTATWGEGLDEVWTYNFPEFMSFTLGGTWDFEGYNEGGSWSDYFGADDNYVGDTGFYGNWYWWMAEGVRRELSRIDAATNLLSRLSDGLDQIHTINYEILQSISTFNSSSNVITHEEFVSETNTIVATVPGFEEDTSEYDTNTETNDLPFGNFFVQSESVVTPEFESKKNDITSSLASTWDVQGRGLFRVRNPDLASSLSSLGVSAPSDVGTIEVDLNSQNGHTYDEVITTISDPIKNIYDLAKFLFYILVVYGEIRYYLSGGKTK